MFRKRPTVYTLLLLLALALVFLLVALHNDRTDDRHGPIIHNDGVLNIQQKVLKFELRSKKGQRPSDGKEDCHIIFIIFFCRNDLLKRETSLYAQTSFHFLLTLSNLGNGNVLYIPREFTPSAQLSSSAVQWRSDLIY